MKNFKQVMIFIFIYSLPAMSFAVEVKPLSKEELMPFCQNEMIWGPFNISPEQCLEAGVPCSEETAKNTTDIGIATNKLMYCIFEANGVELPSLLNDLE